MRLRTLLIIGILISALGVVGAQQPAGSVDVTVIDQARQAVPGVRVEIRSGAELVSASTTEANGHAAFTGLPAGQYRVLISKEQFEPLERELDLSPAASAAIEVVAVPALARHESVNVSGTAAPVEEGSAPPTTVAAQTVKQLPSRPATVADALPLTAGVVREPGGGLVISASPEHRSALIVNSADVTDPATGQFGLTVPIDSVEVLNVYQTAYLAEYGRFSAGLVSVETRRGGDKWKWELNDPLPDFRIRSWRLRGLKDATPRVNFEGPLLASKVYVSEGAEYEIRKTEVYTLPFPYNQKKQEGFNTFTQIDWIISAKHLLTATFHAAPQRLGFVNLDYFNPEPTTPDASTHNYTGTVGDHLTIFGGVFENTFSITRFDASAWPRGNDELILTPEGNQGNYFAQRSRSSSRTSGRSNFAFAPVKHLGTHNFKIGGYMAGSEEDGQVEGHPIQVVDSLAQPIELITFPRVRQFEISDFEYAFFAQDHWELSRRVALDLGIRTESQQVSGAVRVAPRAGIAWSPIPDRGTTIRAGFGFFYDHVPLNIYTFNKYPDEVVTMYAPDGEIVSGPTLYLNTLGQSRVRFPFVFQRPVDGNFSPRSGNWSVDLEQPIAHNLKLRVRYLQNDADGLVILSPVPPTDPTSTGSILLSGSGAARYRQLESTARLRLAEERELFFSYVRSRARGDLNDFAGFLGNYPSPIIRPNEFGTLPVDLPNRFLCWGVVKLPERFRIAPAVEYRSGFPYIVTDAAQNYFGIPNQDRFPNFLSVDARVSKDIQVNPKYAVRLSVSGFNLTNHFNPEAVHANVADPAYGFFFGHRGRRFTADFDVLF